MYANLFFLEICITFIIIAKMYKGKNCDIEVKILGTSISIKLHDKRNS